MYKNKFSKNAISAINYAANFCIELNNSEVILEHLFMGILRVKEGIGARVLASMGIDPVGTLKSIEEELSKNNQDVTYTNSSEPSHNKQLDFTNIKISDDVKKALDRAFDYAVASGSVYVGTEHLLLGLLSIEDNNFVKELNKAGLTFDKVKIKMESSVSYPNLGFGNLPLTKINNKNQLVRVGNKLLTGNQRILNPDVDIVSDTQNNDFLNNFGYNLTLEAKKGNLDPVIGRDKEIERVMQILARRRKNNPILLGDAGVGKTAIVEGLAQRIVEGNVSPILLNLEIWSIDTAFFLAGSQLRGDLESKVLDLIKEVENRGNVILFIDEIHTIVGAGSTANNPVDIGNILKPALARGSLRCIGATTVDEYRKHFDEDPALQRRFQPVEVEELSESDTYAVLKVLKTSYEKFHDVKISDSALKAAVKLSSRYITDRYLPDKAIDVLDEACARNRLSRVKLSDSFRENLHKLEDIVKKKNEALRDRDLEKASMFLDEENKLMDEFSKMESGLRKSWNSGKKIITDIDVRQIVSEWTKIPMSVTEQPISEQIKKLVNDLQANIIGQDYATKSVINAIRRAKVGLAGLDKPLASFLFVGPTGVGKTELAKQLAKSLFGSRDALIQVDMSELMEYHSVSKLIGAPPGYIGFDRGGQLTDKVRRTPFSVVLFDEIEKADPAVLNILLQILDEGKLTDSKGRVVNFKNTIIIMTSNIGSDLLFKNTKLGLFNADHIKDKQDSIKINHKMSEVREKVINELKEYLNPEFLNRIDNIVIFRPLNKKDILKIVQLQIQNLVETVRKENRVCIKFTNLNQLISYIADIGFLEEYGAREIKRVIKTILEDKIADFLISKNWSIDMKKFIYIQITLNKKGEICIDMISDEKLLKVGNKKQTSDEYKNNYVT